jgi:hypothetical protein
VSDVAVVTFWKSHDAVSFASSSAATSNVQLLTFPPANVNAWFVPESWNGRLICAVKLLPFSGDCADVPTMNVCVYDESVTEPEETALPVRCGPHQAKSFDMTGIWISPVESA